MHLYLKSKEERHITTMRAARDFHYNVSWKFKRASKYIIIIYFDLSNHLPWRARLKTLYNKTIEICLLVNFFERPQKLSNGEGGGGDGDLRRSSEVRAVVMPSPNTE